MATETGNAYSVPVTQRQPLRSDTGETMRPLAADQNALASTKLQRSILSSATAITRIEA